jgi:hypothetical protein
MSFNKRFYTWEKIKNKSKSDFNEFDTWLCKPDSHILSDKKSSDFFSAYFSLSEDLKESLYESIREEEDEFLKDLIKFIKVFHNEDNEEKHTEVINNYKELFTTKWNIKSIKYKNLIEK